MEELSINEDGYCGCVNCTEHEQKDMLISIFRMQKSLQARPHITKQTFIETVRINTLALHTELSESLQETNWKPWRDKQTHTEWLEQYKGELIDCMHFFVNLCLNSGMNAEEVYRRYIEKNKINQERMRK